MPAGWPSVLSSTPLSVAAQAKLAGPLAELQHVAPDGDEDEESHQCEAEIDQQRAVQLDALPIGGRALRAQKIGRSILNTAIDHPWSDYYCCTTASSANYLSKYPVASKRVLRAILKAADLCVAQPKWVARQLVDRGFDKNYDLILQTLADVRYDRWRDFDIEDTVRFYALRMHSVA